MPQLFPGLQEHHNHTNQMMNVYVDDSPLFISLLNKISVCDVKF